MSIISSPIPYSFLELKYLIPVSTFCVSGRAENLALYTQNFQIKKKKKLYTGIRPKQLDIRAKHTHGFELGNKVLDFELIL